MNITVVIPCYNAENYVAETLATLSAQTYRDWESVCVDDGSHDGTCEVIKSVMAQEPRLRLVRQANQGAAAARNAGFAAANPRSQYCIFLDSDDLWEPHTLQTLFDLLQTRTECVGAYGLPRFFSMPGDAAPTIESWGEERTSVRNGKLELLNGDEPTTFAELVYSCIITTPGQVLIRKSAIEAVGPFDTRAEAAPSEDWDYWIRLSRVGPLAYLNRTVLHYRRHPNNISANLRRLANAESYVLDKAIRSVENTPEQKKWAVDGCRSRFRRLARSKVTYAAESLRKGDIVDSVRQMALAIRPFSQYLKATFR